MYIDQYNNITDENLYNIILLLLKIKNFFILQYLNTRLLNYFSKNKFLLKFYNILFII